MPIGWHLQVDGPVNVLRAITGSIGPKTRQISARALFGAATIVAVAIPVLVLLSLAQGAGSRAKEIWRAHHEACHGIPEEVFHRDRFRAIRGRVTDGDGQPVAGALVRCARLESLIELAMAGAPAAAGWSVPIEAETRTDDRGRYDFPHLSVGGRTFFYSAPAGRDLAPAIKDLVVVQDGLGAQLDVTLAKPAKLLVRFRTPVREATRLYLIPQRWWPVLESATVPATWRAAEFRQLGGPFRKGLIAMAGPDASSPLRIIGRYDLDRSTEVDLSGQETPITRQDLPEAAGIEPWRFEPSSEERLFYAAMSPVPLFWPESPTGWPSWLSVPAFLARWARDGVFGERVSRGLDRLKAGHQHDGRKVPLESHIQSHFDLASGGREPAVGDSGAGREDSGLTPAAPPDGTLGTDSQAELAHRPAEAADRRSPTEAAKPQTSPSQSAHLASTPPLLKSYRSTTGIVRGFAPHPFLPVLVESHTAAPRLAWTSDASEFEVDGLPPGSFRVRALDLFGRVTFAAGVTVRPDRTPGPDEHVRVWSKVDLDEPDSREVIGFVKWESGSPAAKAVVFMQCSYNFRRYVRRVEADEQGFFRFSDVPANEPYFLFALPPGDGNAMKTFEHFVVGFVQREVWHELTLHPHRIKGTLQRLSPTREEDMSEPPGSHSLLLVRAEGGAEQVVWTIQSEPSGRFTVSNVPHGQYRVQVTRRGARAPAHSLPFEVGDGHDETVVRWSP